MLHKLRLAMAEQDAWLDFRKGAEVAFEPFELADEPPNQRVRHRSHPLAVAVVAAAPGGSPIARIRLFRPQERFRGVRLFLSFLGIPDAGIRGYHNVMRHPPTPGPRSRAHALLADAKAFADGLIRCSGGHMQSYLDEFCWRFNRRPERENLFDQLLSACIQAPPVTDHTLLGRKGKK
jgi:hypothetical protein